jgi:hypothetical protein
MKPGRLVMTTFAFGSVKSFFYDPHKLDGNFPVVSKPLPTPFACIAIIQNLCSVTA